MRTDAHLPQAPGASAGQYRISHDPVGPVCAARDFPSINPSHVVSLLPLSSNDALPRLGSPLSGLRSRAPVLCLGPEATEAPCLGLCVLRAPRAPSLLPATSVAVPAVPVTAWDIMGLTDSEQPAL